MLPILFIAGFARPRGHSVRLLRLVVEAEARGHCWWSCHLGQGDPLQKSSDVQE